jgi:hypothetical protein
MRRRAADRDALARQSGDARVLPGRGGVGRWGVGHPRRPVGCGDRQGLIIAGELLFIVFGAVLLLNTLEESGGLAAIRQSFRNITPTGGFR